MTNSEDLVCDYDCCKMILESPVTLPCGNTLCKEHLDKFYEKFTCFLCNEEHQIPKNGFVINKTTNKIINNYINLNPLRKKIKASFEHLSQSIDDYEKVDPDSFVYDYFAEIRNKVDLHREELKREVDQKSDEIIQHLKEREQKCKANLSKVEKENVDELKKNNLPFWKQKLRMPNINENDLNDLSSVLNDNIKIIKNRKRKYENSLLLNKSIKFDKYEKSSLFGKLIINNSEQVLSSNVGELIRVYEGHSDLITSIEVDEKSNKLISASADSTIKIWNLATGECLKTLEGHTNSVLRILLIPNNKLISSSDD